MVINILNCNWRFLLILTFLHLLLISQLGFAQGTNYVPVQYNFPDLPLKSSNPLFLGDNEYEGKNFSSMAANGYGQWVAGDVNDYLPNWMLLGNGNADPQTGNLPIPSGVVAFGHFNNIPTKEVKVATNLHGSVRYVGIDRSNNKFIIEGFNDQMFLGTNPLEKQISINIPLFSQPASRGAILNSAIFSYPDVLMPFPVVPISLDDKNWHDHFDIAMDGRFLYIVWATPDPSNSSTKYRVVGIAIDLITDARTNFAFGSGSRPTVACDPRNIPLNPTFEVAWILGQYSATWDIVVGKDVLTQSINNGQYVYRDIFSNPTPYILPKTSYEPTVPLDHYSADQLAQVSFTAKPVLHARIMVSSIPEKQLLNPSAKSIYVLRYVQRVPIPNSNPNPNQDYEMTFITDLLQYKFNNTTNEWGNYHSNGNIWGLHANYVEGPLLVSSRGGPLDDAPHENPPHEPEYRFYSIFDMPIVSFANPYDGRYDNNKYEEYHCLYQLRNNLNRNGTPPPPEELSPLCMVRDDNNGIINANEPNTRTILNRQIIQGVKSFVPNPNSDYVNGPNYVGAPNQMGLHIRWKEVGSGVTSGSGSFYMRDTRTFDEDIDENSLVTYDCYVADGTTHDGTLGAQSRINTCITLWTDPNFGVTSGGSGIYTAASSFPLSWQNGRLIFKHSNTMLQIGEDNENFEGPLNALLTVYPNFEIWMGKSNDYTDNSLNHALKFNRYSQFNFLGIPTNSKLSEFLGNGSILTMLHSKILIWPGADFRIPDYFSLATNFTTITSKHGASIFPPFSLTNPAANGIFTIYGVATLSYSVFNGELPFVSASTLTNIDLIKIGSKLYTGTSLPTNQFTAVGSTFAGTTFSTWSDWLALYHPFPARMILQSSSGSFRNVSVTDCKFGGFSIYAENPVNLVEIQNSTFCKYIGRAIEMNWYKSDHLHNNKIMVVGNDIRPFPTDESTVISDAILFNGFEVKRSQNVEDWITISNNKIWGGPLGLYSADYTTTPNASAIRIINASALITGNYISGGYTFKYGISNEGTPTLQSNSYLCSNNIEECSIVNIDGAGIFTKRWEGIGKLNHISNCDFGHIFEIDNNSRILNSRYTLNKLAGLYVSHVTSKLDLSGIHNTLQGGPDDYPAFDTIDHNNQIGTAYWAEIFLVAPPTSTSSTAKLVLGTDNNSSSTYVRYGHNNIISNSTSDYLIHCPRNFTPSTTQIIGMNENYWATGTGAGTSYSLSTTGSDNLLRGVTYDGTNLVQPNTTSPYAVNSSVQCGEGNELSNDLIISKSKHFLTSIALDSSQSYCDKLYAAGHKYEFSEDSNFNRYAVDTLKLFIESCANLTDVKLCGAPWRAFGEMSPSEVDRMSTDNERWIIFRDWLKKVLYLNPDTTYYCADVSAIISTFNYISPTRGLDRNGEIAVMNYILKSNKCFYNNKYYQEDIDYLRSQQYHLWRDTVQDSLKTPLDTTLPTLEELGLSILRGPNGSVHSPSTNSEILSPLTATKNPFSDETELLTTLAEPTMLRLEVFDVLGKQLISENRYCSAGVVKWLINGKSLPRSSIYARLSTTDGVVKSIKLVRE